jgi:hypothetical protein
MRGRLRIQNACAAGTIVPMSARIKITPSCVAAVSKMSLARAKAGGLRSVEVVVA